jgi:hypothetical protein
VPLWVGRMELVFVDYFIFSEEGNGKLMLVEDFGVADVTIMSFFYRGVGWWGSCVVGLFVK